MVSLPIMLLTTFITLNGQIAQVPIDSPEALAYEQTETNIGKYDFSNSYSNDVSVVDVSVVDVSSGDVSSGDSQPVVNVDNSEIAVLLNEQIELLAENSSTVTGTLNNTVLDLMDRMIDDVPSYFKYAGFRTSADDAYQSILYLSKKATLNDNVITFGDDCIAVHFYRNQYSNYNYYVTYDRYESPNATVYINDETIVYTNVADGFPSLGNHQRFEIEYFWIGILVIIASVLFIRRNNNA